MIDPLLAGMAPAPSSGGGQGSSLLMLIPWVLIFVVFYFLLIAPARKRQKQEAAMRNNLKAGDRVITSGGIYGTVVGVADNIVQLRIADQVKTEVAKQAITGLQDTQS
jgi:preprotein translocase subunit YajC